MRYSSFADLSSETKEKIRKDSKIMKRANLLKKYNLTIHMYYKVLHEKPKIINGGAAIEVEEPDIQKIVDDMVNKWNAIKGD